MITGESALFPSFLGVKHDPGLDGRERRGQDGHRSLALGSYRVEIRRR